MPLKALFRTLIVTSAFVVTPAAWPAVVFDNFGPNNETSNRGNLVGGFEGIPSPAIEFAAAFTVSSTDLSLERLDIALALFAGINVFTAHVYDSVGGLPSTLIASRTIANAMPQLGSPGGQPIQVTFAQAVTLEAGKRYWFSASVPGATTSAEWLHTVLPQIPVEQAYRIEQSFWAAADTQARVAFRVVASPIPEPLSAVLLAFGLAATLCISRVLRSPDA